MAYYGDEDEAEEEGSPDAWFQGYTTGKEELVGAVQLALGKYAPQHDTEEAVLEAVAELSARMEGLVLNL